jgi:hypothetical protein
VDRLVEQLRKIEDGTRQNAADMARLQGQLKNALSPGLFDDDPDRGGVANEAQKKITVLAATWGKMPEKERAKALQDLTRDLPPATRQRVEGFFTKLTEAEKAGGPQVWKRDRQRPTFARVYVGDNTSLELVSLQVTVTVEGPRARTLVDHIFRNPHDRQLEGTFEYPLPTGASPAYFAMFLGQSRDRVPARFGPRGDTPPLPQEALARLAPAELVKQVNTADWGRLQEARVVAREKALEAYEEVVRGRIDPALLEYAGGNTFSGRVFPIPPKGYNRVLIAYEELLPAHTDRVVYRYPLPDCKLSELQLTLQARAPTATTSPSAPRAPRRKKAAARSSSATAGLTRDPAARRSSPTRRPTRKSRRSAAGRASPARATSTPASGPLSRCKRTSRSPSTPSSCSTRR